MSEQNQVKAQAPLYQKIIQFPLTRIILALLFVGAGMMASEGLFSLLKAWFGWSGEQILVSAFRLLLSIAFIHLAYLVYLYVIEKRRMTEFAIKPAGKELLWGILVGAGFLTLVILIMAALGYYKIESYQSIQVIWPVLLASISAGYVEELMFRAILYRIVEEKLGTIIALIISGLLFGFMHIWNDNATIWSSVSIALTAGILLGAVYTLTGRIWIAIGLHFAWNFTQGGIFGAAISGNAARGIIKPVIEGPEIWTGGAFGPEASVITIVLGFLISLGFVLLLIKRKKLIKPFWIK